MSVEAVLGGLVDSIVSDESPTNLRRMLESSHNNPQFKETGEAVGAIIGIVYVFAFFYYLSVKYFNHIIEDLVYLVNYKEDEDKEIYRPLVYCVLNSIPVLTYLLTCVIRSDYDSGFMLVFSTDMININLIYGLLLVIVILPIKKEGSDIDGWLLLRDTIWYSIGVGLFCLFDYMTLVTWWAGIIFFLYYFFHLIIQSYNESIRDEIFLLVGLKHEDDSFNADEQTRQKKRRISITELSYKNCIDKTDEHLQKKIMRMDALLRVKFKDQTKKRNALSKWQVAVYTVMFAVRNKHRDEKNQRSINYAKLFAPVKNCSVPSESNYQDVEVKPLPNEDEVLIDKAADIEDQVESKKPLSERKIREQEDQNFEQMDDLSNKYGNNNYQQQVKDNQSGQDVKPNSMMNDDPQMMDNYNYDMYNQQDKFQVGLGLPNNWFDIICHIIFFPIHLIIFLLPNYHINPSHRKLAGSFFVNLIIIIGLMILLEYLMDNVTSYISGHTPIYSITITGLFLQLPFFVYNYQFAKKEKDPVDFLLTFIQLGIFKIGFVIGLACIVSSIAGASTVTTVNFSKFFDIVLLIIIAIIIISFIVLSFNNFKANRFVSKYLLFTYCGFFVAAIILLAF